MIQVAGMQIEIISVHGSRRVLELDDDFNAFTFDASRKVQQWMFVQTELGEHAF